MLLGLIWTSKRIAEGDAHLPDAVSRAVVRVVDGPSKPAPEVKQFEATIAIADRALRRVDTRFLSTAIDMSMLVGGHWWSESAAVEATCRERVAPLNLNNGALRALASELSPGYIHIGGTESDKVQYLLEASHGDQRKSDDLALTREHWDPLMEFVQSSHLELFFTLNAGPRQRDAQFRWRSDNTEQLLRYARAHAQRISVFEFGNEINGYWYNHGMRQQPNGEVIAHDLERARAVIDRFAPGALLAGPSEFYWPRLGSPFAKQTDVLAKLLSTDRGRYLGAVTWHYYPQQSRRCPVATRRASLTGLLDPNALDEVTRWSAQIAELRSRYASGVPIWLTETGGAQCGGEPGTSDRYVSSLWWLDQLGLLAVHDHDIVVRQTLVGSNYGLIDEKTFAPRPDYFASVLHKRLMGTTVLDVQRARDADPYLRVYSQCTPAAGRHPPGRVTVLAINLHQRQSAILRWPQAAGHVVDSYPVTAPTLESPLAFLNGEPMLFDGSKLNLKPHVLAFAGSYMLSPASFVFLVADIAHVACSEP